ncbi:MAG: hypothetical protein J6A21_06605, partial [Lentisphaeria bacterium]|nr:hypothetical protein [Lentisphaeria bacterium]
AQTVKLPPPSAGTEPPAPEGAEPGAKTIQLPGTPPGLSLKKEDSSAPAGGAPGVPAGLSLKKDKEEPAAPPPPAPDEGAALNMQDPSKNRKGKKLEINDDPINVVGIKPDDADAEAAPEKKSAGGEPSLLFAITAIIALLLAAYLVFVLAAQYSNIWEGKNIPVIGFSQQGK